MKFKQFQEYQGPLDTLYNTVYNLIQKADTIQNKSFTETLAFIVVSELLHIVYIIHIIFYCKYIFKIFFV